ncbi:MAG: hypothetical protein SH859_01920 [Hyphomicrobium aestuarii]|nr:hypothetical protein [Hyphomicrobium aestuarii]
MILRILVLIAAVQQFIFPIFVNPFRDGGRGLATTTPVPLTPSQIEPAGYAFAIWGPIYLLAIAYAVWQLTPSGRADPVTRKIAPYAIIVYAGSSLWLTVVSYGPLWASMPILGIMAACASAALIAAVRMPEPSALRLWLATIAFGLYAGWKTCATFVNIAEVAPGYGFARFGLGVATYGVLSIAVATVVGGAVLLLTRGTLAYAATILWALAAIAISAMRRDQQSAIVVASVGAIIAVVIVTAFARASKGRSGAKS